MPIEINVEPSQRNYVKSNYSECLLAHAASSDYAAAIKFRRHSWRLDSSQSWLVGCLPVSLPFIINWLRIGWHFRLWGGFHCAFYWSVYSVQFTAALQLHFMWNPRKTLTCTHFIELYPCILGHAILILCLLRLAKSIDKDCLERASRVKLSHTPSLAPGIEWWVGATEHTRKSCTQQTYPLTKP